MFTRKEQPSQPCVLFGEIPLIIIVIRGWLVEQGEEEEFSVVAVRVFHFKRLCQVTTSSSRPSIIIIIILITRGGGIEELSQSGSRVELLMLLLHRPPQDERTIFCCAGINSLPSFFSLPLPVWPTSDDGLIANQLNFPTNELCSSRVTSAECGWGRGWWGRTPQGMFMCVGWEPH